MRGRSDKVDVFIRVYDGTRYLVLFGPEKFDGICNRTRYLINQAIDVTHVFSHNHTRTNIDLNDSLPLEKN